MKMFKAVLAATAMIGTTSAMAADAKFTLVQEFLGFTSSTGKEKSDGSDDVKTSENGIDTLREEDLEIQAQIDKLILTASPFGGAVKIGYFFMDELEAGAGLSIDSLNTKEGDEESGKSTMSSNDISLYATYTVPTGVMNLEIGGMFGISNGNVKAPMKEDGEDSKALPKITKISYSGNNFSLGVTPVFAIAKNLDYVAGLAYTISSQTIKRKPDGGTELEKKTTNSTLNLTLAEFRYKF